MALDRSSARERSQDRGLRAYFLSVYFYMSVGLGVTAGVAALFISNMSLLAMAYQSRLLLTIMTFGLVWMLSSGSLGRLGILQTQGAFFVYATLMGVLTALSIFPYTGENISRVFLITAMLFGSMSIYGYTTQRDLSSFSSMALMGIWGIFLASLVNIILGSTLLMMMLSWGTVVLFTGLVAYDTQYIKELYRSCGENNNNQALERMAIHGALMLYIDVINIFLSLMRLSGERK